MNAPVLPTTAIPTSQGRFAGRTIVVTGAGGAIGRRFVPWLAGQGAAVVAVGRQPARLTDLQGAAATCAEEDLPARLAKGDVDAVVDLAVLNSDAATDPAQYRAVNFERVENLARAARASGVQRVVVLSSYHASDPDNRTGYAASKRALEAWAAGEAADICRVVVMPKIAAGEPGGLSRIAWRGMASARPAAFFADAAEAIARAIEASEGATEQNWVASQGHHVGYSALSRTIDLAFAIAVLVGFGWLMIILTIAVRLDSAGPAIFRQKRVGRGERPFVLYKFRTMALGTPEAGTHQIAVASVTRVGAFLRRTKLDELPQAWNILRGELTLVGPRPCLLVQEELIAERRAHGVFALRPGLTGLAQVNGIDMSDPRELVRWEVAYMRTRGLLLDLRIVWQTFVGRGGGDRVAA